MPCGIMWCFVLLIISVGFSEAQNDNDSIIFPGQTERSPKFPLNSTRRPGEPTSPSTNGGGSTTFTPDATYNECLNSCLTTSEYNPICGSDNAVYSNPGRFACAQNCGNRELRIIAYGRCSNNTTG
ncbi:uncharacterized protein LOC131667950 isoform X2 [Phymastichus coffea]|uniref:uncharacterized protein LOC131667950 isoform X2 n=1 Tax=Phymastichus coffea TaxID=108790 RepID=UPI00273C4A25|nr:uncharacterized protein LOC131667950 isoform X2 [Phymastichus coffea]